VGYMGWWRINTGVKGWVFCNGRIWLGVTW